MQTHWSYRLAFYTLLLVTGAELATLLFYRTSLPPAVPLWHSRPWGEDQLAHPLWLLVLPVGSLLVFIMNTFMASRTVDAHPMFGRILLITSVFVSILSLITMINTLSLVI